MIQLQFTIILGWLKKTHSSFTFIYPENPIWVGHENGKKGPVNQMAGLVKSSEMW